MPEERKAPKVRKCRICKKRYKPLTLYQWWCSEEHQDELIKQLTTAARKKRIQQQEQVRKIEAQQEKRHLKIRKLALKPSATFTNKLKPPSTSLSAHATPTIHA